MSDTFTWSGGEAYERYIGRWSRPVAREFVEWLGLPPGLDWLDAGCGTGALSAAIVAGAEPRSVCAYDLSPQYAAVAARALGDEGVRVGVADARSIPEPDGAFGAVVSGLMINFVPEPADALREMVRVAREGGTVAAYVWDYADGMEVIRRFWQAAAELDPAAAGLDEGRRFPVCGAEPLTGLFRSCGLRSVEVRGIDPTARFQDFGDYWEPFLGGQGPAPGYVASLDDSRRKRLEARLRAGLPEDGPFQLGCRAWAVRGVV